MVTRPNNWARTWSCKEDLDEVVEGPVPAVDRQYSDHGDALAHRAGAYQYCSAYVRDRSPRIGRPQFVSLGPRPRLWWRLYQFGILQTNGSGHVGLSPDHPTTVASRTGHLRLRPGDRATAPSYDDSGVGV